MGELEGGYILKTEERVSKLFHVYTIIIVSISTDARDGTSEISPDPSTKSHTVAETDSLGVQSTLEIVYGHIYLSLHTSKYFIRAFSSPHGNSLVIYTQRYNDTIPISLLCSLIGKYSSNKDIGMVFVYHCCVTTPLVSSLFGPSNHPYIPLDFEEMILHFCLIL